MVKLISLSLIPFMLINACSKKQERTKAVVEKITESVYASGIIKSKDQYQVFSIVSGLIDEILVTEGDQVKKGDAIMRLISTAPKLNTENAKILVDYSSLSSNSEKLFELKSNIDLAKAKMENDALMLQRQQNLWNQMVGTHNELEQRALAYQTSSSAYENARLHYAEIQKQINFEERQSKKNLQISTSVAGDYTIKSVADGKVYNILKEKGEFVNTLSSVALIGDSVVFLLELQVDEYDIARIKFGQKIIVTMDSYKGLVFDAIVRKIYPTMNERSKSFTIEAAFIKQPVVLYPNLTCEANIVIQQKEKAMTIPRNYLLEGDFVLMENKMKRKVNVGLKDYQRVEILNGLTIQEIILKPN